MAFLPLQYSGVDAASAALAATAAQPESADPTDSGVMQAAYRQRRASVTAKPQVGGHAPGVAPTVRDQYMQQQLEQQRQQQQPHVATAANPYQVQGQVYNPYGGQAQPNANFNPAGVTLGDQYKEVPRTSAVSTEEAEASAQSGVKPATTEQQPDGRNVELLRGGQSHVEHFGASGSNEGVVTPQSAHVKQMLAGVSPEHAGILSAYAATGATPKELFDARMHLEKTPAAAKPTDFNHDPMVEQAKFRHGEAIRRIGQIEKENSYGGTFDPKMLSPTLQQEYGGLQKTANDTGQVLSSWTPPAAAAPAGAAAPAAAQAAPAIPAAPKPGTPASYQVMRRLVDEAKNRGWSKEQTVQHAKEQGWVIQ